MPQNIRNGLIPFKHFNNFLSSKGIYVIFKA